MQDKAIDAGVDACKTTFAQDIADQRVALTHVLALDPIHLRIPDLVRELTAGSEDSREDDNMERAVRDLTGIGLLDCPCGLVAPSRQALHFDLLMSS